MRWLALLFCFLCSPLWAASVQWDASIVSECCGEPTGYRVYYGSQSDQLTTIWDNGLQLSFAIPESWPNGTYFFGVKAYNAAGESGWATTAEGQTWVSYVKGEPPSYPGAANLIASKLQREPVMAQGFITQQADRSTPSESTYTVGVPNKYIFGEKYAVPADAATVTELGVYCDNSGQAEGGTFRMALYSVDGDGDLDNLIAATSTEKDPPTSEGWIEWTGLSIDISSYQSQTVAIVIWPDDGNFDFEKGLSTGSNAEYYNAGSLTNWEWPDIDGGSTAYARTLPLYAVYTTGGTTAVPANRGNRGIMVGMSRGMWLESDWLKPIGGN